MTTAVTVDINGDLDVDGHTNLDNVSVSGIITANGFDYKTSNNVILGIGANGGNAGARNVIIGEGAAGDSSYSGTDDVIIGYNAGNSFTTGGGVIIGKAAGNNATDATVTYVGKSAGQYHTGSWNAAFGGEAMQGVSGSSNGTYNTAVGQWALRRNQGQENTAVGSRSMRALTTSSNQNTGVGALTLHSITSNSSENTVLGYRAGDALVTGSNNIIIGHEADASTTTTSNEITLGDVNITHLRVPGIGVSFNNTGGTQLGIITATELDISGDIDVDGHTNLDNVSVAGVTTFSNTVHVGTGVTIETNGQATFSGITTSRGFFLPISTGSNTDNIFKAGVLKIFDNGSHLHIQAPYNKTLYDHSGTRIILTNDFRIQNTASSRTYFRGINLGAASLYWAGSNNHGVHLATTEQGIEITGHSELDNVNIVGVTTAAGHVLPSADVTYDLGSSSKQWRNLYADNIVSAPGNGFIGPDLTVRNLKATGISTFDGTARFNGRIAVHDGTTGSNGQYLKSVGTGVTWATFPTLRTRDTIVASAGQTSFTFNYTVNFIDVFVNGIKLTDSEFTATNGTDVVLAVGCFVGDIVAVSYTHLTLPTKA